MTENGNSIIHTITEEKSLWPFLGCVFEAMGPSKNVTWRCLKDSLPDKNGSAKNGPKMIPKWFKIAQIA